MKNKVRLIKQNFPKIIAIIVFAMVAILVSVFFTNDTSYQYTYEKGEPWDGEDLISSFDFPVYKSEERIKNEKDSIEENLTHYYIYTKQLEIKNIKKFKNDIDVILQSQTFEKHDSIAIRDFADKFSQEIEKLYKQGIIQTSIISPNTIIKVFRNGIAEKSFVGDYNNAKTACLIIQEKYNSLAVKYALPKLNISTAKYIEQNITFDQAKTNKIKEQKIAEISPVTGIVKKGELIISKGEPISEKKYNILESLKKEFYQTGKADRVIVILGNFVIISLLFTILYLFITVNEPKIFRNFKETLYIISSTVAIIITVGLFKRYEVTQIYVIPFAILPILTVNLHSFRTAIMQYTITMLIVFFLISEKNEFLITQLTVGYFVTIIALKVQKRASFVAMFASFLIFVSFHISFTLMQYDDLAQINYMHILLVFISSALLLLGFILRIATEKAFGYISKMVLLELSDLNSPLLKRLSMEAPGTFQHSLQVANLAEAIAIEVGANPYLIRTGALYHDIGKLDQPQYFIENQVKGYNPHDNITPLQSAEIIRSHVLRGIEIAKAAKLPEQIINFIRSHHGTSTIFYFYHAEKTANPDKEIDPKLFSYPGPKPSTKEEAILMFTDSVEAASRSLKQITEETVDNLIEGIINKQVANGQIEEADITFKEIATAKEILKQKIKNIYHTRIEYPKED